MMPRIDTALIEGYEGMDAEARVAALEAFEYEAPEDTGPAVQKQLDEEKRERGKVKTALDKALKEISELKKGNKDAHETAEAIARQQLEDWKAEVAEAHKSELEKLEEQLEDFRKRERVSSHKALYAENGITDEKTVKQLLAFVESGTHASPEYQGHFAKALARAFEAKNVAANSTMPAPNGQASGPPKNRAELMALPTDKIAELKRANPDEYERLMRTYK